MVTPEARNHVGCSRHGHRQFNDGNAPASDGLGGEDRLVRRTRADGRDDGCFIDLRANLCFRHPLCLE
jgi:hypothetical protein